MCFISMVTAVFTLVNWILEPVHQFTLSVSHFVLLFLWTCSVHGAPMESITRIALLFYQRTGFEGHELRTAGRTRLALQLGRTSIKRGKSCGNRTKWMISCLMTGGITHVYSDLFIHVTHESGTYDQGCYPLTRSKEPFGPFLRSSGT